MIHRGRREYAELLATAFDGVEALGARHMIALDIKWVQTSCGLGVPLFDFVDERRGRMDGRNRREKTGSGSTGFRKMPTASMAYPPV
jgi:hypothetical protein